MFCQKCGAENPDTSKFCNSCGSVLVPLQAPLQDVAKHNTVITAKIKTKKDQIEGIGQTGPALLIIVGIIIVLFFFGVLGVLIGAIVVGLGIWWGSARSNEEKKLRNEVKELEAELEPDSSVIAPPMDPEEVRKKAIEDKKNFQVLLIIAIVICLLVILAAISVSHIL